MVYVQFTRSDAGKIALGLVFIELGLVGLWSIDAVFGLPWTFHALLNLDGEATIPAWFSAMLLFAIGGTFLLARFVPRTHDVIPPNFSTLLGLGFVFLSMDEAAAIHEMLTAALKHIEWVPRFRGQHGIWIGLYGSLGLVVLYTLRPVANAVWKLYFHQAMIFSAGAAVFLLGAVGLEVLGYEWALNENPQSALYLLEVAVEEFMEMLGATLMYYAALLFLLLEGEQAPMPKT